MTSDTAGKPSSPKNAHKCPKHNMWMRKNKYHPELGKTCELCLLELDKIKRQNELTGGSNKPKVVIRKI